MAMQNNLFKTEARSSAKELRIYQQDAVESIFDYFSERDGSPIVVVPTAGGKSLIIAEFIRQANEYFPGTTVIVVSHSALLLDQNAEELLSQYPDAKISFYSDTLGQKDLTGDAIFAGVQSIYRRAYDLRHSPDLILVDEAHTIGPDDGSMYRTFLEDMKIINPAIKIVGFTATPFRAGYGMLHKGKNALFTDICYEISILELIQLGHLCPIITPEGGVSTHMTTAGVAKSKGDFVASQLAKVNDIDPITRACVDEIIIHGDCRKKWMIFTIDINHCTHVFDELVSRGIDCEMVHSKMDSIECNRAIDRFKKGGARCLVNVAMLTTGANFPQIDMLVFMRPTRSPVLYVQMAGRGMRLFPGKIDCLLLDFGGVVEELGPIDQVRVPQKGEGTGDAPVKACENCGEMCAAGCAKCPFCGHEFPENELNLETKASSEAALSSQLKAKDIEVTRVAYYRNIKDGRPDTLRVDYLCGFDTYREWKCFQHSGFPREQACTWWKQRTTTRPPNDITEALQRTKELKIPKKIHVKKVGKYHEIVGAEF